MLGLRRLKLDAIWLEHLPSEGNLRDDQRKIDNFQRQLRAHGLDRPQPRPRSPKFTTIGQWYWGGAVEVDGTFPDLSKKYAFEQYLDLPSRVPKAKFELAMHMNPDDPERERLRKRGWHVVDPHCVARTPKKYRSYLASALGEFTAIKGVDVSWKTGWLSDRAAAFLAMGRPVVT